MSASKEHRRVRELVRYLGTVLVGGALTEHQQRSAVRRAHLDPALGAVGLVAAQLETDAGRPELLRAFLVGRPGLPPCSYP